MKSLVKKLAEYFSEQDHVQTAWLFGSQVEGIAHSESDVDLALLFPRENVPSADRLLQIQDDITSLLRRETDIVVLNDASPIIRMQVLQKGEKVFERDKRASIEFFVRTINEYDDLKRAHAVIEKKIARGRIYG